MGKLLCIGTHATDDPTRATFPFAAAVGTIKNEHEPMIVLMGEAVTLLKKEVLDSIHGVGFPPLNKIMDTMLENGVPFYI